MLPRRLWVPGKRPGRSVLAPCAGWASCRLPTCPSSAHQALLGRRHSPACTTSAAGSCPQLHSTMPAYASRPTPAGSVSIPPPSSRWTCCAAPRCRAELERCPATGQPSRPATRPEAQADWAQHPEPRVYLYRPRAAPPPGVPKAPNPSGPGWSGGGSPEPGVLSATSDERMYLRSAARAGQRSRQARTATLLHLSSPFFTLLQPERSRGIGLLISSDGHRLVGNDQRVRSVPRSACAVTDTGLRVGAEVGQDTLLHRSALTY